MTKQSIRDHLDLLLDKEKVQREVKLSGVDIKDTEYVMIAINYVGITIINVVEDCVFDHTKNWGWSTKSLYHV